MGRETYIAHHHIINIFQNKQRHRKKLQKNYKKTLSVCRQRTYTNSFVLLDQNGGYSQHLREVRGSLLSHDICSEKWGVNFTQNIVCFSSNGRGPCAVSTIYTLLHRRHNISIKYVQCIR